MAAAGVCPCSSKCLLSHMENSSRIVSTLVQGIFASKAIDNIGDQPCIICPPWQNKFSSVHSGLENTSSYPSRNPVLPSNERRRAATCHGVRKECYSVKWTCERCLVGLLSQTMRHWLEHHGATSYSLFFLVPYQTPVEGMCWQHVKLG